jgi:hypothetical protein
MLYSISGLWVELQFKYPYGIKKCEKYLCQKSTDESVTPSDLPTLSFFATDEEIEKEASLNPNSSLEIAEFDCVFRKLYTALPKFNRMLMHGAALEINGEGFLFTAPSGVGKSTHLKLWGKRFKNAVTVINGDKPILSFNEEIKIWGSPRSGKEGWDTPTNAPLKGIVFLERGEKNEIFSVTPSEIVEEAYIQFYIPKDEKLSALTFQMIETLLNSVPLYKMRCNMDIEAAEVAYNMLTGKN